MLLQAAGKGDVSAMAALHALCFDGQDRWSETQIAGSLALETTVGFVAREAKEIVGFLLAQKVGEEAEILTLCVRPAHREQGIGAALVEKLLAETEAFSFFLDVAEDNHSARRLYERCGFRPCGGRPRYYKRGDHTVDAVCYRALVKK